MGHECAERDHSPLILGFHSRPLCVDGHVIVVPDHRYGLVTVGSSTLYAIKLSDGTVTWQTVIAPILGEPDTVVLIQSSNNIRAFDARSGANVWTYPIDGCAVDGSLPAIGKTVLVSHRTRGIVALAIEDGNELWSFKHDEKDLYAAPNCVDGKMIIGTKAGKLICLERN